MLIRQAFNQATLFNPPKRVAHTRALDPRLIKELTKNRHDVLHQAAHSQRVMGYQTDNWELSDLQTLTSHTRAIVQSLAYGTNSLCKPASFTYEDIAHYNMPVDSSVYFATPCAYTPHQRIHNTSPGAANHLSSFASNHYAAATQTKADNRHGFRSHLGIFNLIKLLKTFPELSVVNIAIAPIKANPQYGSSNSLQIVVPHILLPFIHTSCRTIITHEHNECGITTIQNTIDQKTKTITWQFDKKNGSAHPAEETIHIPYKQK